MPAFKDQNTFVRTLLGGWEAASIVQVSSGTSLTPRLFATGLKGTAGPNFQAGITGTGTAVANQRPLRDASQPCTIKGAEGTFINPKAWTLVGYKIGETIAKRTTCLGPPTKNVDLSFYKNFSPAWLTKSFLGEGARVQFRFEFFNILNTTQFRGDSLQMNFYNDTVLCGAAACSAANNTITSAGVTGGFGVAGRSKGAREIQYALKLYF